MEPIRSVLSLLVVSCFVGMLALPAHAGETYTYEYTGSTSVSTFATGAHSVLLCPEGCDLDGDDADEVEPLGLGWIPLPPDATVRVNDWVWAGDAAASVCAFSADGDNVCKGDPYGSSDVSCGGPGVTLGGPFGGGTVALVLYALHVGEDLNVCGATKGTVAVTT